MLRTSVLTREGLFRALPRRVPATHGVRSFSVLQRPPPKYDGHVPLTTIEKGSLAAGSAVMSMIDPYRDGMLAMYLVVESPP